MINTIVWHRRDLRIDDNTALHQALLSGFKPTGVFIFDTTILDELPSDDPRVTFIFHSVVELAHHYQKMGCHFLILHGNPTELIPKIVLELSCPEVFVNEDYEPSAKNRDLAIMNTLNKLGVNFRSYKDHIIFGSNEVLSQTKTHYTVFTPYKNSWLKLAKETPPFVLKTAEYLKNKKFSPINNTDYQLDSFGFTLQKLVDIIPGEKAALKQAKNFAALIDRYQHTRDYPAIQGTSRLGVHLRFGTISVRKLVSWAMQMGNESAQTWLSELIWRDFYSQLLDQNPRIASGRSFQSAFDALSWTNSPSLIEAWKTGYTGFPIVDAGMRELKATGHMHNRVRMITASFFTKHLDCDWRLGEKHFADLLLDFDLASNNGGWQWSASTGSDAQPYFRIFNPYLQSEKFDPDGDYIRKWVPELNHCPSKYIHAPHLTPPDVLQKIGLNIPQHYPLPIVDHKTARELAILKYSQIAKK